ncbi:MAG TPA: GntR family transcriptional regulator [Candidatus Limnocylindrales bacterium]|nr:GntR family transcriptional regulator [Candidatus Limnocylindrales bacterium]
MAVVGQAKLASRVREEVRDRIRDGRFADGVQLPPEVDLATSLGVSRTTLREALLQLEQEGLLIRRHGHGTFVRSSARLRGSLNANLSATEVIRSHGMEPGTSHARIARHPASGDVAERLEIAPGTELIELERVRTADRRPVVFTIDLIPAHLFADARVDPEVLLDPGLSLYRLYAEQLRRSITDGQAALRLTRADERTAERLAIPVGSAILRLEQVDMSAEAEPVLLSIESYVGDTFEFSVHRRGPALDAAGARASPGGSFTLRAT